MNVTTLIAVALIAVVAIVLVKQVKPEIATVLTIGVSVLLVSMVLQDVFDVVYAFYDLSEQAGVDALAFRRVIKIVGIGYLTEFANNICQDADCKSIGSKILFGGKVAIAVIALPVVTELLSLLIGMLQQ